MNTSLLSGGKEEIYKLLKGGLDTGTLDLAPLGRSGVEVIEEKMEGTKPPPSTASPALRRV